MEDDLYAQLSSGSLLWTHNPLTLLLRHRQLLATPKSLDPNWEFGSALPAIIDKARDNDSTHFTVYTQFTKGIPVICDYLRREGYSHIYSLQGGATLDEIRRVEQEMMRTQGIFVGSIQFAQSFEFPTARLGFVIAPSWDVPDNEQAEARQRRLTSEGTTQFFYVIHQNTIEERVYDVLDGKQEAIRQTYQDAQDFEEYWRPKNSS
jgi:hypothetical protein